MLSASRVRRVARNTVTALCRRMHPRRFLIFLGEVGVTRRTELESLCQRGRRRVRLLRFLVTRRAVTVDERRMSERIEESFLL